MKPIVAIVGRPNVGKSELFNRILQKRVAIVENLPGVTRDRIYADTDWQGREFTLIDTGGIQFENAAMTEEIRRQAELAIQQSDLILFITDGRQGVTPLDREVAEQLRRTKKPVLLVVNKVDDPALLPNTLEFFEVGLGEPVAISAAHGLGVGDLLDRVIAFLPEGEGEEEETALRVAVIGRPNVGKSSLVNALLGEKRVIVSDQPGTTRDPVDVLVEMEGQRVLLVDTAGMRKRGRIDQPVERYSVLRALRAVDRADVVLLVVDGVEGVTEQDTKIAGYAHEAGKGAIVVINKWDLVEKGEETLSTYSRWVREALSFLDYAPLIFLSAKTRQRVGRLPSLILRVAQNHRQEVATATLNNLIREAISLSPPPAEKGQSLKVYYGTQVGTRPPTFLLFVNDPELAHFSYRRYLENRLREAFGFEGTPLRLVLRAKT
ncbi:MAG: ribosome biogenesis GTPase Der [Firmicutes bacterium]|nr:ribosome biogenesis GTPase Der [Bacillota bacterium]MCL5039747.1 ribosome biogenesis GTPase Der [Bacillota bacterium]